MVATYNFGSVYIYSIYFEMILIYVMFTRSQVEPWEIEFMYLIIEV